jgi:hypothetical protein
MILRWCAGILEICECRKLEGPVLVHKGAHRAQRYVFYGLPAEAVIAKKWRLIE